MTLEGDHDVASLDSVDDAFRVAGAGRDLLVDLSGCTFIEALAPLPLDHVPDRVRDLVLGDLAGSLHVER